MLSVGEKFPQFNVKATVSTDLKNAFVDINNDTYKGKWLVVFFYPKDFTFVCPTEITGFAKLNQAFLDRDAQVLDRPDRLGIACITRGARTTRI